jgi:hypothetical protein
MAIKRYRLTVFGIHLALSAVVCWGAAFIAVRVWYPYPLLDLMGGDRVFMLLLAIDAIAGPLVTLFISSPLKSRRALAFDYTFIGIVQIAALSYGLATLATARPVYFVFTKDRFSVVRANDLDVSTLSKAQRDEFKALGIGGPRWVAAVPPQDAVRASAIALEAAQGGRDVDALPEFYVPYAERALDVAAAARPLQELRAKTEHNTLAFVPVGERQSLTEEQMGYLPLVARMGDIAVVVRKDTGFVLGYVWQNPWQD